MRSANGEGADQDYAEALRWYRLAAEQGNADGQNYLGAAYFFGDGFGVDQDYAEAVRWYRLAAEQGNADAQNGLGNCVLLRNGIGVDQDYAESLRWYRLAVEQGNAGAQQRWLGSCVLRTERLRRETRTMRKRSAGSGWPRSKAMEMPTAERTWELRTGTESA